MPRIQYRPLVATPELQQDWHEEQEPSPVTWPELFFDLYVVAAVSVLSHLFKDNTPDLPNAGRVLLYHALVFFVWSDFATFKTRFRLRGLVFRAIGLSLQLGVLGIVIGSSHDVKRQRLLAGSYAIARVALAIAYSIIAISIPRARALALLNAAADLLLACMAGAAAVAAGAWLSGYCGYCRFLSMMVAVVALEALLPVLPGVLFPNHDVPLHVEHMSERLGQLVMLHLGEGVIGFATTNLAYCFQQLVAVGCAAALVWSLHLCYYHIIPDQHQHAYRHSRVRGLLFFYAHWPLVVAILFTCSALRMMLGTFSPSSEHGNLLPASGAQGISRRLSSKETVTAPLPPFGTMLMLCVAYAAVLHLLGIVRATHFFSADPDHKAVRFQEARGVKCWWNLWWLLLLVWPLPVYCLPWLVGWLNRRAELAGSDQPSVSVTVLLAVLAAHALLLIGTESVLAHKVTQQPVSEALVTGQSEEREEEDEQEEQQGVGSDGVEADTPAGHEPSAVEV